MSTIPKYVHAFVACYVPYPAMYDSRLVSIRPPHRFADWVAILLDIVCTMYVHYFC